jgi:hypothetical protein
MDDKKLKLPFRIPKFGLTFLVVFFIGSGFIVGMNSKSTMSPGPLSAVKPEGVALGGFDSHAAFEQECGHCHAPVHCITDTRCQECHFDVAQERILADGLHGMLPAGKCQTCHIEHQGREAVITAFAFKNVDHEKLSSFSLEQHQTDYYGELLTCESCHSQDRFRSQTLDCITCHVEADHDFMSEHLALYGGGCVPCHDGHDRMADFNHDDFYVLGGAHGDLECEACHADHRFAADPRDCVVCHEDPAVHAGLFGLDCARCHDDAAWQPARLAQHTFELDHGAEENLACQDCHPESYAVFDCYACHEHEFIPMKQIHADEGILVLESCVACHPTGAAGEGEQYRLQEEPVEGLDPMIGSSSLSWEGHDKSLQKNPEISSSRNGDKAQGHQEGQPDSGNQGGGSPNH